MSLSKRLKDVFGLGGFADERHDAIATVERGVMEVVNSIPEGRRVMPPALNDALQAPVLFGIQYQTQIDSMNTELGHLRNLKDSEDGRVHLAIILDRISTLMLLTTLEAVHQNQYLIRSELLKLIDALKAESVTKEDLAIRLESIRKDLALPEPDRKNIEWVRKYLAHASNVGDSES